MLDREKARGLAAMMRWEKAFLEYLDYDPTLPEPEAAPLTRGELIHEQMIEKNLTILWATAVLTPKEIARQLGVTTGRVHERIRFGLRYMERVMHWRCQDCRSNENVEYRYAEYADADPGCMLLCPRCFDKHPDYLAGGYARPYKTKSVIELAAK